jgi:hypothetical protein
LEFDASPRFLLPKFNSVQSIFLKFFFSPPPHPSVLYSLSYSFIFFYSSHEETRERERQERSRLLSYSLCIQSHSSSATKRKERNGPKMNQRKNNRHTYITTSSGTGFIHTLYLFTLDLKGEKSAQEKRSLALLRARISTQQAWQPGSHSRLLLGRTIMLLPFQRDCNHTVPREAHQRHSLGTLKMVRLSNYV